MRYTHWYIVPPSSKVMVWASLKDVVRDQSVESCRSKPPPTVVETLPPTPNSSKPDSTVVDTSTDQALVLERSSVISNPDSYANSVWAAFPSRMASQAPETWSITHGEAVGDCVMEHLSGHLSSIGSLANRQAAHLQHLWSVSQYWSSAHSLWLRHSIGLQHREQSPHQKRHQQLPPTLNSVPYSPPQLWS